ncbi:hypothetical protein NIE88_12615 [Sporolactobacillus shoreicorticis]|uniref:Uncharacterized protein n=1 Tax=Sporolactobacillus shoreicorticis TaxID=1923877 RepID=A0ABW5SA00_9BACL|nr:hypothetical protein [Sporolactobacillus shoreicorticis]MCO7126607.1 hypothetical protein [Sporolactobacillus shoreicorticis]
MTYEEAELKNQKCLLYEFLSRNNLEDTYISFLEELVQDKKNGDTTINYMFGDVEDTLEETKEIMRGDYV